MKRSRSDRPRGLSVGAALAGLGTLLFLLAASEPGAMAGVWPPWADEDTREPVFPAVTMTIEDLAGGLGDRDFVVVDARPADAYLAGHVPGAISIPAFGIPDPPASASDLARLGLTGRERVVCYGESSRSPAAARLFWVLEALGAERVSVLEGGARAWREAGRRLEREGRALPAAAWVVEPAADRIATTPYVALKFGEEGFEIIDARGREAWKGAPETRPVDGAPREGPRTGHIPHALPFEFGELVLPDGRFVSAEDARDVLAAFGPRPSTPVDLWDEFIVYDHGASCEGALGYFLLRRSGVEAVRYYPGGWSEWAADAGLPVVRIIRAEELEARLAGERRWLRPNAPPATFAVFDVRHGHDFEGGHIPGAVNLSSRVFADSLDTYVERHWPGLDRSRAAIVTYCYDTNCIRSRDTATAAARLGFLKVERFYGGMAEWRAEGGRVVSGR
jgi:thiosulfate/3-mercaptopyruvate sulfurtransferase